MSHSHTDQNNLAHSVGQALPKPLYITSPREQLDWLVGYVENLCWKIVGKEDLSALKVEEVLFILEQLRALKILSVKTGDL